MKKYYALLIMILMMLPLKVKAIGSYSVEMVSNSSNNRVVGTYNTYNQALEAMNKQNSTDTSVATIYRNGVPVDSKYAIFKFKPSGNNTFPLYKESNSSSAYTSINTSYVGDAALLGYSENGRVKIMVSSFIGWINIDNGVVTPISLLGGNMININGVGVRLRSAPNTSSDIVANISGSYNFNYTETYNGSDYVWYKINYNGNEAWAAGGDWVTKYDSTLSTYYNHYGPTGNLIHHFTVYSGGKYTDSFTNLGKAPSFLEKDVYYYSFDGNYFYKNLTTMLNDYRNGTYNNSINYNNPHYSYYLYLTSRSTSGYTADDLNYIITSNGYNESNSKMYGTGQYFKDAEAIYGTNSLLAFATALNESAWGTSSIAQAKNNLFGYGASDSCPQECAYSYASPRDSIMDYASKSSASYETTTGKYYYGSHYGNKSSGKNIMYATDPYWGEKMAAYAYTRDLKFGGKDFNSNTIGVTKKNVSGVNVYKNPETKEYLYTMKNPNTSAPIYDFTANIVDKIKVNNEEYYKIYTDLPKDGEKYGYVLASNFNVTNTQPEINADDKEIKVNENFDYLKDVTAYDKENGNITNKLTYEGNVDSTKPGEYRITYNVVDNSNFHASKTITVTVGKENTPIIEAENKEVLQYSNFNYLKDVKAYDNNNELELIYEGNVDTTKIGQYKVVYKAKNENSETTKEITVTVIKNEKPVIEAEDQIIEVNSTFDYLENVHAYDKEDGILTPTYNETVDTTKIGQYKVIYMATDKENQKTEKEITVTVKKEVPIEKKEVEGEFYLEELAFDKNFTIKGYLIQKGVDNKINDNLNFYIVFKNINTNEEYKIPIDRWTENTPYDLSEDKDYSGAWFNGQINLSELKAGDYDIYMRSESKKYYTIKEVNNILNNKIHRRGIINNKSYTFKVLQKLKNKNMQLYVRNSIITDKESPTFRNMTNDYEDIDFNNGKLTISGISYNYGVDYSNPSEIEREIIFENTENYQIYKYDIGSTNEGSYEVTSMDNLSKKYVWFNKEIDIKDLLPGTYSIIIHTKAKDIEDYGELTDMFATVSKEYTYNNKKYIFTVNKNREKRIELQIK